MADTSVDTLFPGANLRKLSSGKGLQGALAVIQHADAAGAGLMGTVRMGDRRPDNKH